MVDKTNDEIEKCQRLRLQAEEFVGEDLSRATETYGKAAAMGDVLALRELVRIGEDNAAYIQDEIVAALEKKTDVLKDDFDFVRSLSHEKCEAISDFDLVRLLEIARRHDVLESSVESLAEWIRNFEDTVNDPEWMFSDGYDDAEIPNS